MAIRIPPLPDKRAKILIGLILALAVSTLIAASLDFAYIFNPLLFTRKSITSTATPGWLGMILSYFSIFAAYEAHQFLNFPVLRNQNELATKMLMTRRKWSIIFLSYQMLLAVICFISLLGNPVIDSEATIYSAILIIVQALIILMWKAEKPLIDSLYENYEGHNGTIQDWGPQLQPVQRRRCKVFGFKVVPMILHVVVGGIFWTLVTAQCFSEFVTRPGAMEGEQYVTVTYKNLDIRIRTQCTGPENPKSKNWILFEAGAGSSGIDFLDSQNILSNEYTVCSYDRAGYGKSWIGPYPMGSEDQMQVMVLAMKASGKSLDNVVCVGHSAGGQLCRYYAKYLSFIKAVVLLDSLPVDNSYQMIGKQQGQTPEEVFSQSLSLASFIQKVASIWPICIGNAMTRSKKGFISPEAEKFSNWQISSSKNWQAQARDVTNPKECDLKCATTSIVTAENMLSVKMLILPSTNPETTCEQKQVTGAFCTSYLQSRFASLELMKQQSQLTNPQAQVEYCPYADCEHDFVFKYPQYISDLIRKFMVTLV